MSIMKCISVCCATLLIALFVRAAPAGAFSAETAPSGNADEIGQSITEGNRAPTLQLSEAAPAAIHNLPSLEGTADKNQSASAVRGSTFDAEETRLVFGPFNHFGYGSANQ